MSNQIEKKETKLIDKITNQVSNLQESGEIRLPENYSAQNNLKSAWLMLQDQLDASKKPVLEACTQASIANAMLKMVIQGLSAIKNQCYFIPYGGKLVMQRSYQGSIALAKRVGGVKEVNSNIIYEGDVYETEINEFGIKRLVKHESKFENRNDQKIKGAYAVVVFHDGSIKLEDMSMDEIMKSWMQGQTNGNSPAHKNFKGEMAKKTVINRALKTIINSSSDSDLYDEDEPAASPKESIIKKDIEEKSNSIDLTFDEVEDVTEHSDQEEKKETPKNKPESEVKKSEAVQTAIPDWG